MIRFDKIGTKHGSYIKKFIENIAHCDSFEIEIIDNHKFNVINDNIKLMSFSSKSTFKQFMATLEALGFIKENGMKYIVNKKEFDWLYITESIFTKSTNKKIQNIRDSRKVSILANLNLLTKKNIDSIGIDKKIGTFKVSDALSESSLWEEETMSQLKRVTYVLERIKNEYKI